MAMTWPVIGVQAKIGSGVAGTGLVGGGHQASGTALTLHTAKRVSGLARGRWAGGGQDGDAGLEEDRQGQGGGGQADDTSVERPHSSVGRPTAAVGWPGGPAAWQAARGGAAARSGRA
jgi:hypothetical protein